MCRAGLEFSPLRARLLLGSAMWRHKPDAFLYYGVTGWKQGEIDRGFKGFS